MRIIRFIGTDGGSYWGHEPAAGATEATIIGTDASGAGCRYPEWNLPEIAAAGGGINRGTVGIKSLLAPVVPTNVFCIGLNYAAHAAEGARKRGVPLVLPKLPVTFMKSTGSLISYIGAPIQIPSIEYGEMTDYECELAVVIGRECLNATEETALDYVLGYTIANDVSARHWQRNAGGEQWIIGKSFDTFLPLGPVLVTADEIPDPQTLQIKTHLNGQTMQDSNTADMIFSIRQIIAWLSKDMRLLPGTVILTGTPEGVGMAREPSVWLKDGDVCTIEIEGIGSLTNPVVGPQSSPWGKVPPAESAAKL
jgi:2-keto-4-pentenoate hydratase/2-oxohepta-3-ene-1,7-dioic acid hydratase in catechol pathway